MRKSVVLGTRGSSLALLQAKLVGKELEKVRPDLHLRLKVIKTKGDKMQEVALARIGDKGLFIKEIEEMLRAGHIDLAVHSMKDMPTETASGLVIAAVSPRIDPSDVLVSRTGSDLKSLPRGARVGTGSLRRKAQLWHFRPDLRLEDLRGNVPTRLARMDDLKLDGIVVAAAGLQRLGLGRRISQFLPHSVCLPAVGQGALGVEAREDDGEMRELAAGINHGPTSAAVTAERAFLQALEGGCQVPIAAYGRMEGDSLHLEGLVASLDGRELLRSSATGMPDQAELLGRRLAEELLRRGADAILSRIRA